MSGNPKPTAAGGQQMRYTTSPYQPIQPPLPPRDSFPLTTQNYVQQQPNQSGNQGAGLRGLAQTGPPNQAPTPPNQDLKVQSVPQQAPMNLYSSQSAVRPTQQYSYRPQGPPNQPPRMANNQHRGQQLYPAAPTQFLQMPVPSNMYMNQISYFNSTPQRQNFVQQPVALLQGQHFPAYPTFNPALAQAQPVTFSFYHPTIPRGGPPPQPTSTPSTPNQAPMPTMPMTQPLPPQQTMPRHQRRRPNAIAIIDPTTGVNITDEIFDSSSHPPSGESSARETPQPAPPAPVVNNKEVQAAFAKQVAQRLTENDDKEATFSETDRSHIEPSNTFHQPPVHNNTKYDQIAQTSTLKAHAKEFVLSSTKETPIVSAMCDAEEVTLPNKQHQKGRESPAKGRKKDNKEHNKEIKTEIHSNKEQQQLMTEKQQAPIESVKPKENVSISNQQVAKTTERDTEKRKKESKSDVKPSETSSIENVQIQEQETQLPTNTKTKQRKDTQKSNQKTNPPSVPAPQPTKSNSKSIKKMEINNKGASKEGTEMDVFQLIDTNANLPSPPPVTATTTTITTNSDVINANTTAVVINNTAPVTNSNVTNSVETNKSEISKIENNDTVTIKSQPEAKPKVDVTMVFGKALKPSHYIPQPSTDNSDRDEIDRASVANDKIIQAKNEANTAKTASPTENKIELPYKKGQWAPFDVLGEKRYDRDFLLAVRNLPITKIKPDFLPEAIDFTLDGNRARLPNSHFSLGRTDFNPHFMNTFPGKNPKGSQSITKHPSLTGKMNSKSGKSTNGSNKISISLREDIKLHETENAWKPVRLSKAENKTEDEKKTAELYKKVRGVLNKLTPEKFDTLLSQIKSLEVDTMERLQGVIDLIFEKAVDEPNFSVAYAKICRELSFMQVCAGPDKKEEFINFRKLLINRCQEEFEKQTRDEDLISVKNKEIEECTNLEKKKEVQIELDEILRRIRMRSVGNVRFIGELFKINMLTANIMLTCLNILLKTKDEESLECLCKLLSTIGKELEEGQRKDLGPFFVTMQEIVDKKHIKCSSRIRFMLQDAIDLRKNKWLPRRQDMNPKTIHQIQKEAENEQLNQAINSVPNTPRRDDQRMGSDMNKGKSKVSDDGWVTRGQRNQVFTVQKEKLKMKAPGETETLGSSTIFQNWVKGSQNPQPVAHTSNKYALLEDMDKKTGPNRFKETLYSSKGSSLERNNYNKQSFDGRAGSRSGSQQRMNDAIPVSSLSQRLPPPITPSVSIAPSKSMPAPEVHTLNAPEVSPGQTQLTEEQLVRFFKNTLEEFINDNSTFEECDRDISTSITKSYLSRMVADGYLSVIEKNPNARFKTGLLFGKLIKVGTLSLEEYCVGLEEIFEQVEDLIIDIPTIWTCLAQIIVPVIYEESLPLNRLRRSSDLLIRNGFGDKFIAPILKLIISDKGPAYLKSMWQISDVKLSDFESEDKLDKFVEENQLSFLVGDETCHGNLELNYEQIEKKLLEFFNTEVPFDDICNWITANVGERVQQNMFIRTLATAIYKFSIVRTKLDAEKLTRHQKLFHRYVDSNQTFELQCLYALQALVHQMEHPQGLLFSMFNKLCEDLIFPQESFIAWENSQDPAEQEGKGVAIKQLTSFFTQLKENDDDEDYVTSGSEDA